MAKLIDGKAVAAQLRQDIARETEEFVRQQGRKPGLAVVLVGEDPASAVYVRSKARQTAEVGMKSIEHRLAYNSAQEELLGLIGQLNSDDSIDGILVQMPLPKHIDSATVIAAIDPAKDVDGFHPLSAGALVTGSEGLFPCTPVGCVILAKSATASLVGKEAVIIGRSNIVGKPLALLLLREHCTVTVVHSRTPSEDTPAICRRADLLVAAVGIPHFVKGDWVKPGAVVIDVGINRIDAGEGKTKLVGDVDFAAAREVASHITPVPGGVGPMTIACLLRNTLKSARLRG